MALPDIDGDKDPNKKKGLPSSLPKEPKPKPKTALPSFEDNKPPVSIPDFSDDTTRGNDESVIESSNDNAEELSDDDDTFQSIPFDEQSNEDENLLDDEHEDDALAETRRGESEQSENPQSKPKSHPQRVNRNRRKPSPSSQKSKNQNARPKEQSEKSGGKGQSPKDRIKERGPIYVDEENKQLKTFGTEQKNSDGKKRKKVTPSKFDSRNNLRKRAMIIRVIVLSGLGILIGLGAKNALFPPDTLEQEEVMTLIQQATGELNFPTDRGSGFVENFMETFVAVDDDEVRQAALNYFYTGEVSETYNSEKMTPDSDFSQQVAYGPVVYDYNVLSSESAEYIVGVAVSTSDDPAGIPIYNETTGETNVQWRFFSVNVYYDQESDAMAIVDNSPNIMPPQDVFLSEEVPEPLLPGTQEPDEELTAATRNAVHGFVDGYMEASPDDTSMIDQYIYEEGQDDPFFLTDGLDGEFELYGEEPISHTAFYADSENPNQARALVEVSMRDTSTESTEDDGSANNVYHSEYMMRLVQSDDGTWYVTQFRPSLYTPADTLTGEE